VLDHLAHRTFLEQNPRVRFHFRPTYSSWLNQVELWFARIERDVIARGVFSSVPDLARKLRRYINAYPPTPGLSSGSTQTLPAASVATISLRQASRSSRQFDSWHLDEKSAFRTNVRQTGR
jgi:DDE superfamily endonuclease